MKTVHMVAYVLLWVGGLNWGLVGLFDFNLVSALGLSSGLENLVYILVGASAVYSAATHMGDCKVCGGKK
jgi:uncharacterized membrane protein YuzA (DUF378 family)